MVGRVSRGAAALAVVALLGGCSGAIPGHPGPTSEESRPSDLQQVERPAAVIAGTAMYDACSIVTLDDLHARGGSTTSEVIYKLPEPGLDATPVDAVHDKHGLVGLDGTGFCLYPMPGDENATFAVDTYQKPFDQQLDLPVTSGHQVLATGTRGRWTLTYVTDVNQKSTSVLDLRISDHATLTVSLAVPTRTGGVDGAKDFADGLLDTVLPRLEQPPTSAAFAYDGAFAAAPPPCSLLTGDLFATVFGKRDNQGPGVVLDGRSQDIIASNGLTTQTSTSCARERSVYSDADRVSQFAKLSVELVAGESYAHALIAEFAVPGSGVASVGGYPGTEVKVDFSPLAIVVPNLGDDGATQDLLFQHGRFVIRVQLSDAAPTTAGNAAQLKGAYSTVARAVAAALPG